MQGLISLLFLIGLLIAWGVQAKKSQEKEEAARKKRHKKISQNKRSFPKVINNDDKDLKHRHLKSTLKESQTVESGEVSNPIDKIDNLSRLKSAVIWSEILSKPVSEREL